MKKIIIILLVIIGIVLITIGLYKIFGNSTKVSRSFIKSFNAINVVLADMGKDMTAVGNFFTGISAKEQAKDYQGIVQDLNTSLEKLADIGTKAKDLEPKIADFKDKINAVKDQAIKDSALKFIDLVEKTSASAIKLVDGMKQITELAKKYYEDLAAGKKATIPTAQLTSLQKNIQTDTQESLTLSSQLTTATQELAKLANFKLKPIK